MARFLLIALALVLTSCGMKKNMDEMHDATVGVKEKTDEMYSDLRQGDAAAGRRGAWDSLLAADAPQDKLIYAAQFVRSFDFQMWSGLDGDNSAMRNEMAKKNAEEFMLMIQGLVKPGQTEAIPFADTKLNPFWGNRIKSFNAIAVALQETDPKQFRMGSRVSGFQKMNFLTMLQTALRASFKRRLGQSIDNEPPYVREILNHERTAVLLMKTRMNYSAVLALGKVTDICNGGFDFLKMRFMTWTLDMSGIGIDEIRLGTEKLQWAADAHDFLRSVGITPVMNGPLKTVMGQMRITDRLRSEYQTYQKLSAAAKLRNEPLSVVQLQSRPFVEINFVKEYVEFRALAGIQQSY